MRYIDIEYANKKASDFKIYATEYPSIPASSEKVNETQVPGRNGVLRSRTGKYEEVTIPIELNYIGKETEWYSIWRKAKEWLAKRNAILKITDDQDFFYKISCVKLNQNERITRRIGKFTASFVSKDGLSYFCDGANEMSINEARNNPGIICEPIYKITGEGVCNLTVNGVTIRANVAQNLTIDTEKMMAYREDGTLMNTSISGDYEDLYLQPGENSVSITSGFTCKIIPNWRCL